MTLQDYYRQKVGQEAFGRHDTKVMNLSDF